MEDETIVMRRGRCFTFAFTFCISISISFAFFLSRTHTQGGSPVQCRVVQGKEPDDFCQLWRGKMLVHQGGKASAFANRGDADELDTDGVALYHVKGTNAEDTRAVRCAVLLCAVCCAALRCAVLVVCCVCMCMCMCMCMSMLRLCVGAWCVW